MLFASLQSFLHETVHGGMTESLDHRSSDRRGGKLEHGLDTAVGLQEAEAPVDGEDALGNTGQNGIEFGALAVRSAIEVTGLPGNRFDVALRRAQTAGEIEGERTAEIPVGHAAQGGAQTHDPAEVTDKEEQENRRREKSGYQRPVQRSVLPAWKQYPSPRTVARQSEWHPSLVRNRRMCVSTVRLSIGLR
jgi:hypothetical protein